MDSSSIVIRVNCLFLQLPINLGNHDLGNEMSSGSMTGWGGVQRNSSLKRNIRDKVIIRESLGCDYWVLRSPGRA